MIVEVFKFSQWPWYRRSWVAWLYIDSLDHQSFPTRAYTLRGLLRMANRRWGNIEVKYLGGNYDEV